MTRSPSSDGLPVPVIHAGSGRILGVLLDAHGKPILLSEEHLRAVFEAQDSQAQTDDDIPF